MPKRDKGIRSKHRRAHLLILLNSPNYKTIKELHEAVNRRLNTNFSRKCIERDLDDLSDDDGLEENSEHPNGYRLASGFPKHFEPRINKLGMQILYAALAKLSVHSPEEMKGLIATFEAGLLTSVPEPQRKAVEGLRPAITASALTSGKPKTTEKNLLASVFEALRTHSPFTCKYHSPYKKEDQRIRKFAPLLVQFSGGAVYLVVEDLEVKTENPAERFKRIHLGRVSNFRFTKELYTPPPAHSYKDWHSDFAGLGGANDKPQKVKLSCGKYFGRFLLETELHPTQSIVETAPDRYQVSFEVPLGSPLVRILAGFAWDLYSIEPTKLRKELTESIDASSQRLKSLTK